MAAIHAIGAKAYVYQQTYWAPLRRQYQGFRIGSNEDWAYCLDGDTPLEVPGKNDEQWVFIDLNERAVQDYLTQRFQKLKEQGWDGIFFDRGGIAMAGYAQNPQIWNQQSSCTQDPVIQGAAFADTWIDASGLVKQTGLDLIVNYGLSPFDSRNPMRPDPHSDKCKTQNPDCPILEDAWTNPTWVSDESIAHPRATNWDIDYQANLQNEQNPKHGGQVLGLITVGTLGGDKSRENVFFEWARVKLFDIPLGVAVWDREKACPGVPSHESCDTLLTYPELTGVQLGKPIEARPDSSRCEAGKPPRCVWSRRYEEGAMVANVQGRGDRRLQAVARHEGLPVRARRGEQSAPRREPVRHRGHDRPAPVVRAPAGLQRPADRPVDSGSDEGLHTQGRRRHHRPALRRSDPEGRARARPRTAPPTKPSPRWASPAPSASPASELDELLVRLQRELFVVGAELATAPEQPLAS